VAGYTIASEYHAKVQQQKRLAASGAGGQSATSTSLGTSAQEPSSPTTNNSNPASPVMSEMHFLTMVICAVGEMDSLRRNVCRYWAERLKNSPVGCCIFLEIFCLTDLWCLTINMLILQVKISDIFM